MADPQVNIWVRLKDQVSKNAVKAKTSFQSLNKSVTAFASAYGSAVAGIAVASVVLKKAFDFAEQGAKLQQLEQAFANITASMGADSQQLVKELRAVSAGTISSADAIEQANKAIVLGIDAQNLPRMMEIARASSRAFGKDISFMFDSMATGLGRQSKLILDNLGIIVDANTAYQKFAQQQNTTVEKLSEVEKKQAFVNEAMLKGQEIIDLVGVQGKSQAEIWATVTAQLKEWGDGLKKMFSSGLLWLIYFHRTWLSLHGQLVEKLTSFFSWYYDKLATAGEFWAKVTNSKTLGTFATGLRGVQKGIEGFADGTKTANQEWQALNAEIFEALTTSTKLTDEQKEKLQAHFKKIRDSQAQLTKNTKTELTMMEEFAKESARNIQTAFSDFFFNAFTGQLQSAKQAFADFGRAVVRTISNIVAQTLVTRAFTSFGLGGLLGGKAVGSSYIPQTGAYLLHKGERVETAGNSRHEGGGITVNVNQVIQAWDASDVYRNRKALSTAIAQGIRENDEIRSVIKQRT